MSDHSMWFCMCGMLNRELSTWCVGCAAYAPPNVMKAYRRQQRKQMWIGIGVAAIFVASFGVSIFFLWKSS